MAHNRLTIEHNGLNDATMRLNSAFENSLAIEKKRPQKLFFRDNRGPF